MRERTGGYDPTLRKAGEPAPEHYCTCGHLKLQHGRTEYNRSRPSCWWCACNETHAEHRAAEAERAAS